MPDIEASENELRKYLSSAEGLSNIEQIRHRIVWEFGLLRLNALEQYPSKDVGNFFYDLQSRFLAILIEAGLEIRDTA